MFVLIAYSSAIAVSCALSAMTSIRCFNRYARLFCTSVLRTSRPWTKAEDARLKSLVEKRNVSVIKWADIAAELGSDRDSRSIQQRYEYSLSPNIKRGRWKREELQALSRLAEQHPGEWKTISNALPTARTSMQVRERILRGGKSGRRWTEHEDAILRKGVKEFGRKWARIAEDIHGKTDSQCLQRWFGTLDPAINLGPWDEREDKALLEAAREFCILGNWPKVANIVGSRNRQQCRARWLRLQAKEMREKKT